MKVEARDVPEGSLLAAYALRPGHHTDCFEASVRADADLSELIGAFYTQPLFRAERLVLRLLARSPSTDAEVAALSSGASSTLAVWTVEARRANEVLLRDQSGRTGSWLQAQGGVARFGSLVVPVPGRGGRPTLGPVFQSLMGAHAVYSRALLAGAARRLQ